MSGRWPCRSSGAPDRRHRRGRLERAESPWCRPRARGECARRERSRLGLRAKRLFAREAASAPAAAQRARPPLVRRPSWSTSTAAFAETICAVGSRSLSWRQTGASAGPSSRRDNSGAASRRMMICSRSSSIPGRPLEDDDLARVAGDARGLEIEDRSVLCGSEKIVLASILDSSPARERRLEDSSIPHTSRVTKSGARRARTADLLIAKREALRHEQASITGSDVCGLCPDVRGFGHQHVGWCPMVTTLGR